MTTIYEPELRRKLYNIPPVEALFKLTRYINTERLKIHSTTSVLDYWIIQGNIHTYERLSKELVENDKIAPPY